MIKHILNPPNWFTMASLVSSGFAMTLLVGHEVEAHTLVVASVLIFFAGVFDLLDGRVARMTNRASEFGVQLDSIADMVSFGVAPALLAWAWILHDLGSIGALVAISHIVAVALRLARFNVDAAHKSWPLQGHSRGLTSTMAGAILTTLVWLSNSTFHGVLDLSPWVVAAFVVAQAVLVISSFPFRNFRDVRQNKRARAILALALMASLLGAVAWDPSMLFGVGATLYLFGGLIDGTVVGVSRRVTLARARRVEERELQ